MQEQESFDVKDTMMMKMGCERCENYISSARAILYIYQDEEYAEKKQYDNLWHLINLMSLEIDSLTGLISGKKPENV